MRWLFLPILIIGTAFILAHLSTRNIKLNFTSPLPSYLNRALTFGVSTLNLWLPKLESKENINQPQISAKSALVYDLTNNKILFSRNPKEKLPVASLVKIMTAIVALESGDLDEVYTVSERAVKAGENSMGLTAGERLTLEELLWGLLLVSGNDVAEVIAENFSGGRDNFIKAMNDKVKTLGLTDTFFINPTGLEEDGKREFSTTYDLLVMTKYGLSIPKFAGIVSTYEKILPYSSSHKAFFLYNDTNLLTTYPGVRGVKTGYTPSAGLCLVTYTKKQGREIIGIVLNSQSRREEMRNLLDYAFGKD